MTNPLLQIKLWLYQIRWGFFDVKTNSVVWFLFMTNQLPENTELGFESDYDYFWWFLTGDE